MRKTFISKGYSETSVPTIVYKDDCEPCAVYVDGERQDNISYIPKVNESVSSVQYKSEYKNNLRTLQVEGNTEQQTYEGYNLFDIDNPLILLRSNYELTNGYIPKIENGIIYSGGRLAYSNGACICVKTDGVSDYTFTYTLGEFDETIATVRAEVIVGFNSPIGENNITANHTQLRRVFDLAEGKHTVTINCQGYEYIGIAWYTNEQYGLQITDLQIEKGDVGNLYEPYVGGIPSPNPGHRVVYPASEVITPYIDLSYTSLPSNETNYLICSEYTTVLPEQGKTYKVWVDEEEFKNMTSDIETCDIYIGRTQEVILRGSDGVGNSALMLATKHTDEYGVDYTFETQEVDYDFYIGVGNTYDGIPVGSEYGYWLEMYAHEPVRIQTSPFEETIVDIPAYPQEIKSSGNEASIPVSSATMLNNMNIGASTIEGLSGSKVLYVPIQGGKKYDVSIAKNSRFSMCTTTDIPARGVAIYNRADAGALTPSTTLTTLSIVANEDAKYLVVRYFYSSTDTYTEQEILDTIQISFEKGLSATIKGINEFDISKVHTTSSTTHPYISSVGENSLTITVHNGVASNNNGYATTGVRLSTLCPDIQVGKDYVLTFTNSNPDDCIDSAYLEYSGRWNNGTVKTITQALANQVMGFFGLNYDSNDKLGTVTISNIMITKVQDAEYEPYFEPTSIQIPQSVLPNEYQQVEYIESTGTQYIDTGVLAGYNSRIYVKTTYDANNIVAVQDTTDAKKCIAITGLSNIEHFRFLQSAGTQFLNGANNFGVYEIELDNSRATAYYNGTTTTVNITDSENVSMGLTFFVFARNIDGVASGFSKRKLYALRLYDGDLIVRDYVPCYRKSDNAVGLYDLINREFYINAGTDSFKKGADVNITFEKLGNYANKLTIDRVNNKVTYLENCKTVVYDSSRYFELANINKYEDVQQFTTYVSGVKRDFNKGVAKCSHLPYNHENWSGWQISFCCLNGAITQMFPRSILVPFGFTHIDGVSATDPRYINPLKNWLQDQKDKGTPFTVCVVVTPTEYDLTNTELGTRLLEWAKNTKNQTNIIEITSELNVSKTSVEYAKWGGSNEV